METLTKKQPDDQSAIDFCTEKRELFTLLEDKFNNDKAKLYAFIRGVSMVANLNNPSAVEHLIMYLSEKEQKNEVPKLEDLENKIRTFGDAADLRRSNDAPKNLALSATDKDDKPADNKGKKKKGGRGRGGGRGKGRGRGGARGNWGGNYYQGGFQGYGSGRGNGAKGFGQWWWSNPKKKQSSGKGKGKGDGKASDSANWVTDGSGYWWQSKAKPEQWNAVEEAEWETDDEDEDTAYGLEEVLGGLNLLSAKSSKVNDRQDCSSLFPNEKMCSK